MEKSCETCGFLRDGFLCGLDGVDIRVGHCEKYKAWKPKDVNQEVAQNDLLKSSDICLGACSDKSCSTCRHAGDRFSDRCFSMCFNYSLWEPKESDIHTAQEAIDRAFTAFTDKLKGCDPEIPLSDTTKAVVTEEGVYCGAQGDCEIPEDGGSESELNDPVTYEKIKAGMTALFSRPPLSDTQKRISEICDEVKNILLEKNRKYGDSALNPKRVFSKSSPIEQINVRIDDKISRIMSAQDDDTEDTELDLIGYLILKRVAKSFTEGK